MDLVDLDFCEAVVKTECYIVGVVVGVTLRYEIWPLVKRTVVSASKRVVGTYSCRKGVFEKTFAGAKTAAYRALVTSLCRNVVVVVQI